VRYRSIALLALSCWLGLPATPVFAQPAEKIDPRVLAGIRLPSGALVRLGTDRFRLLPMPQLVFLSPDGSRAALAPPTGGLDLYSMASWKRLHSFALKENRGNGGGGTFSADGKELIVCDSQNGNVCVWDTSTGRLLRQFNVANNNSRQPQVFAFAARAPVMVGLYPQDQHNQDGSVNMTCGVWDYSKGGQRHTLTFSSQSGSSNILAVSPDGRLLAIPIIKHVPVGPNGGREEEILIQLWDLQTGKQVGRIHPDSYLRFLAFSPDGRLLAASNGQAMHQVYHVADGKLVAHLRGRRSNQSLCQFTPDGKALLLADAEGNLQEWDLASGERRRTHPAPSPCKVAAVTFRADGTGTVLGLRNLAVVAWEIPSGNPLSPPIGHANAIVDLRFSAPGEILTIDGSGEAIRWDIAAGKPIQRLTLEQSPLTDMSVVYIDTIAPGMVYNEVAQSVRILSPRADLVATVDANVGLCVHALPSGKILYEEDGTERSERSLVFFDGGRQIAGVLGKYLHLWQAATGRNRAILPLPLIERERAAGIAAAAAGKTFALLAQKTSGERRLVVWQPQTNTRLRVYDLAAGEQPTRMVFSPDGQWLAVGLEATKLVLIRLDHAAGDQYFDLGYDGQGFSDLAFSPDGRVLAAAAQRYTEQASSSRVFLVELASRKVRLELDGHARGIVRRLAFTPDSNLLATGSSDTSVLLWHAGIRPTAQAAADLAPAELEKLWASLAATNAGDALQAQRRLASAPAAAVPFLVGRLRPADTLATGGRSVVDWIADLSHESYAARSRASQVLEKIGPAAVPALRQALREHATVEAQRRMEELLNKLAHRVPLPEELAQLRAVEVLEVTDTAAAREHLRRLAAGHPLTLLTQAAETALRPR
jgi:WD40 repeat protein